MTSDEELEQNTRITLLRFYSSQLISHAAILVSTLLIVLGLIQIKLRFFGILSILWWVLFWIFVCGSIYLPGRLTHFLEIFYLVIS